MTKPYDATQEFKPFEKTGNLNGRHPRRMAYRFESDSGDQKT